MVDLATFRTFPRASPGRQSEAQAAEPDVPADRGTLTGEALPTRFTQELRARRRAARIGMRQSEAWAEPEIIAAPSSSTDEPEAPHVVEEPLHPEPFVPDHAPASASAEPVTRHIELDQWHDAPPLDDGLAAFEGETLARSAEHAEFIAEPLLPYEEPAAEIYEATAVESAHSLPSRPVPIDEFLAEAMAPSEIQAPVIKHLFESSGPVGVAEEALRVEQPWPVEPPSELADDGVIPVEPPKPLEPEKAEAITLEADPEVAEADWTEAEIAEPVETAPAEAEPEAVQATQVAEPPQSFRQYYSSDPLALEYRLLGLANPLVVTVTGRLGDATPIPLTIGRTGIYRPDGFRPAPWSGFAYDISPDGRTGLVLGTRILTARGEIPVEDLVPGDTALALRGPALLPIVWIGRSIAVPPPVEIAADAFGPGRPGKALRVGADHPIFMQTMPVPARDLVNGDTIRILDTETAELFHIDVGFAEVLLAEGIPLSSGYR